MNYIKIYKNFIADRSIKKYVGGNDIQIHHIIPKSKGGSDDDSNLIRLNTREHVFAHRLLFKIYKDNKMLNALKLLKLAKHKNNTILSGTRYIHMNKDTYYDIVLIDSDKLHAGAKVLYIFITQNISKTNDVTINMTATYLMDKLGISDRTYKKYIKQLKEVDLLYTERVGPTAYDCYVGTTVVPASVVREYWKELTENDTNGPLTKEDIEELRKTS